MERTFETHEPIELYVELGSGDVHATTVEAGETHVQVTGPRADEFEIHQDGRQVSVVAPRGGMRIFGNDNHQVVVRLPHDSDVATKTGSADTVLNGRYAQLRLKTGSGDTTVDEAAGPVLVESGSGDLEIGSVGEIRVKSGSGDVEIGESTQAGVSTGSGDVTIGRARGATNVKTGSGDLQVRHAEDDVTLATASGDLHIGNVRRGRVSAKNVSGDVVVEVVSGTPVWTDISTTTGDVVNRLQPTGEPAEGQEHVEIRATTVTGDVLLRQV